MSFILFGHDLSRFLDLPDSGSSLLAVVAQSVEFILLFLFGFSSAVAQLSTVIGAPRVPQAKGLQAQAVMMLLPERVMLFGLFALIHELFLRG